MALKHCREDEKKLSDEYLSSTISSSTLEIVLDDQLSNNSDDDDDDDSHERVGQSEAGTTNRERLGYRRNKQMPVRNPKSHRLIEKRRRDRMNGFLSDLLKLVPHDDNHGQRRIEKTEIIEMAIKHIRYLISTLEKKSKVDLTNIDAYQIGYQNAWTDFYDFLNEYTNNDQLLMDINNFFKERDIELKNLSNVVPDRKRGKYATIPGKRIKSSQSVSSSSNDQIRKTNLSDKDDDRLCVISEVTEYKHTESSYDERPRSNEQTDSRVKVPIFVLHPSGTHYIPMCIDASVVSHAFEKRSNVAHSSMTTDQLQCHPVSIPVNFNPPVTLSDPYELDIQNINVIGTRHQTSVRPD
ncbi:unnamed protein product [Adineta ricciae]|uniref:BHLH domain-containing protein n=1 Tax=Adineta ricciae TaxID=249248 RepID=A0A813YRS7_ADIRI|nr:unnamed protein product [Adineta ricciae]